VTAIRIGMLIGGKRGLRAPLLAATEMSTIA
jgi:hypothetical protein